MNHMTLLTPFPTIPWLGNSPTVSKFTCLTSNQIPLSVSSLHFFHAAVFCRKSHVSRNHSIRCCPECKIIRFELAIYQLQCVNLFLWDLYSREMSQTVAIKPRKLSLWRSKPHMGAESRNKNGGEKDLLVNFIILLLMLKVAPTYTAIQEVI